MAYVSIQPKQQYNQSRHGGSGQAQHGNLGGNGQRRSDAGQARRDEPRRVLVFRRETQADFGDFAR